MTAGTTTVSTPSPRSTGLGQDLYSFVSELYPICRSITGDGLRETLRRIAARIPLQVHEVASGTPAFDWVVPPEWNIRDAYVKNSRGDRVIDFQRSNLHVVNYSVPVRKKLPLRELKKHIHSLPEHPDWIPYHTSYYRQTWGFCMSQRELDMLPEDQYEVLIDSSLEPGHLSYGELLLRGESADEVLISTHCCHPSLCNDNLSGVAIACFLAQTLQPKQLRYSYRFLFIPGTIGSITWLSRNEDLVPRIKHGLVLACLGDNGEFSYKRSRRGNAEIDRAVFHLLTKSSDRHSIRDFSPYGYDERQYCSPAFNLPIGCLNRTHHGEFAEYHTSADNLDFVSAEGLRTSLQKCLEIIDLLEQNRTYRNLNPQCEPQLGKRGLYRELGGRAESQVRELAMLWVLNLSDGEHSLLDIAERSELRFSDIEMAATTLSRSRLLALQE
jgi:aminopeptidase-like protein